MRARAVVTGRRTDRYKYTWLRIPSIWPNIGLTFAGDIIPWGLKSVPELEVEVDLDSLRNNGTHYVADLEIIGEWKEGAS